MKIGFVDSGLGGAKTLKDIVDMGLTGHIYFLADTKNCPYGIKSIEEVNTIMDKNIEYLVNLGCKIIVVACNTATSVAIKNLREKYRDITIIGSEPAIKVALDDYNHKKVIVLATTRTVKGNKIKELIERLDKNANIELVAADKLVTLIEDINCNKKEVIDYLKELLNNYNLNDVSHIVLGCTHFPIVKDYINEVVSNYHIKVVDGNNGIGKNLLSKFNKENILIVDIIVTQDNNNFKKRLKEVMQGVDYNISCIDK